MNTIRHIKDHFSDDWTPVFASLVSLPDSHSNGTVMISSPLRDDDHTPSFKINLKGERAGWWHDFGTDESGDAIDLFQRIRGLSSFSETLATIESEFIGNGMKQCKPVLPTKGQRSKPTREEAREDADRIWNAACHAAEDHPYLKKKNVKAYGLRESKGNLLVRVTDGAELHSLQIIKPDGWKQFLTGGRTRGCYFPIGTPDSVLYIAEGYATAATIYEVMGGAVVAAFSSGQLLSVAQSMRARYPVLQLILCADDDPKKDGSNPGMKAAQKAAEEVNGFLAVPDFGENRPEDATDFNDLCRHAGPEVVRSCIERAGEVSLMEAVTAIGLLDSAGVAADLQGVDAAMGGLKQLGSLLNKIGADALLRAGVREEAVNRLRLAGIKSPSKMVDAALKVHKDDDDNGQGQRLLLTNPEPWDEPVDGAELLEKIVHTISRYVVLPAGSATAVSLWGLFSHAHDLGTVAPILSICSPTKRCGKSTLMMLVGALVPRPLPASNITAAALFRAVEACSPTLLIDEADTFLKGNEDLRGIINSGHTRAQAYVLRCDGDNNEPRAFSTWCPKVVAMIGQLPDTLADRSIIVPMRRKAKGEGAERLRLDKLDLKDLCSKAARWVADNENNLRDADPVVSDSLDDRAQDNWRRLLAIADCAGGSWPARARRAAEVLSGGKEDDGGVGTLLLADLKSLFDREKAVQLSSDKIVTELIAMQERPWPELRNGKALSTRGLARLLTPFGVKPEVIRFHRETKRGYKAAWLEDAWTRYLAPDAPQPGVPQATSCATSVTPVTTLKGTAFQPNSHVQQTGECYTCENTKNPHQDSVVTHVTLENTPPRAEGCSDGSQATEEVSGSDDDWKEI
jgi:putative DNA primase/helicase